MRTEVKIGMAVGLLVVVIAFIYFVGANDGEGADSPDKQLTKSAEDTQSFNRLERAQADAPSKADAPEAQSAVAKAELAGRESPKIIEDESVIPAYVPPADVEKPVAADVTVPEEVPTESIERDKPKLPIAKTYIVQKGDNGFWAVAAKVYGDGRYWQLIADANPKAQSSHLRAGQKLIIPPLDSAATAQPVDPVRFIGEGSSGEKIYVVQSGDAGFWGISKQVYGHGKYYTEIAKANPGVDPLRLRPGQKLIVPPIDSFRKPGASKTASTSILAGGQRYYIVQAGDAGFWEIAKKMYGDGKYHTIIARANPRVDARTLKPGQKLVIPKLTEAEDKAAPAEEPAKRTEQPTQAGGSRPLFE